MGSILDPPKGFASPWHSAQGQDSLNVLFAKTLT
jgi:hypothetical protein